MINIAQTTPALWSPPVSGAVAPVAAVSAVRPLQEGARHNQQGTDRESGAAQARPDRRAEAREGTRPGRNSETPSEGMRTSAGRADASKGEASEVRLRREAEQNAKQLAAEQAAEEERRAQRQDLLTNVWKASAAVVERVLGRDEVSAVQAAAPSEATSDGTPPVGQLALPWPVMPQEARLPNAAFPAPEEVVAYDERGNGNLAPIETGMLVNERV